MKKYLIFLLLPLLLGANTISGSVLQGATCGAAGACSASTDYIGDKSDYSASSAIAAQNNLYCLSYQATTTSCSSGTWGKGYIAHNNTDTDNAKICIYTDSTSGTGAPNDETLIACSTTITCSTDNATPTCTNDSNIGGTATKDAYYFVCMVSDDTAITYHRTASGSRTLYNKLFTSGYSTPPSTLTATGWTETTTRDRGLYVEIY